MNKLSQNFMALLSAAVLNKDLELNLTQEEFEELFKLSCQRRTAALCGTLISRMYEKGLVPDDVKKAWTGYCFDRYINEGARWNEVRQLIAKAQDRGIHFLFFKGYLLAELYPGFGLRNSSDTDILIREKQLPDVRKLMEEDYLLKEEDSKEKVLVYEHKTSGHYIEIHLQLWEDYEGKKIDILKGLRLDGEENLIQTKVFGQELTTMNPTNHLIYQIFHIVKHFCVQGISIRYLLDTALFADRYIGEIDWKYFWQAMEKLEYIEFCKQFFSLGVKYFKLNVNVLPEGKTVEVPDEDVFVQDMVMAGMVNEDQKGAYQIWGIMSPYVTGEIKPASSKFGRMLQTLFPSAENIRDDFSYAKRHKILLPIAWVHRWIDYLIYRKKHPDESYGVDTKINAAEYRVDQVKKRGLV